MSNWKTIQVLLWSILLATTIITHLCNTSHDGRQPESLCKRCGVSEDSPNTHYWILTCLFRGKVTVKVSIAEPVWRKRKRATIHSGLLVRRSQNLKQITQESQYFEAYLMTPVGDHLREWSAKPLIGTQLLGKGKEKKTYTASLVHL